MRSACRLTRVIVEPLEGIQLSHYGGAHAATEDGRLEIGLGAFLDDLVHDAVVEEILGAHVLGDGHFRRVSNIAMDDHACSFRRKGSEPAVVGGDDSVGRDEGESSTASALAEDHRD